MHQESTDVLIVGAGPTGLTMAVSLARQGVDFRILERLPEPNTATRAKGIQPRSLEVLDDLGAIDHVLDIGRTEMPMRFHNADGTTVDRPTISVRASDKFASPYPDLRWIGQFSIEGVLRARLAELGAPSVEFAVEVVSLRQDRDGVTASVLTPGGPTTVSARYVLGADGGHSVVRGMIGVAMEGETIENEPWYFGDVACPALDRQYMHIWTSDLGMVGLTPLPASDLWQFQLALPHGSTQETPSLGLYQRMLDERAATEAPRLTRSGWLTAPRGYNARMASRYRVGRVFLAGDAAHSHSAAGGQGMNTGIQDSYNLGWKIAAVLRGASDGLLDTYEAERKPVAQAVLADSNTKMQKTASAVTTSSEEGLGDALNAIADDVTTGLPISYPHSALTLNGFASPGTQLAPGDRVPNATGLLAPSGPSQIFDLLRGSHWTLLVFEHEGQLSLQRHLPDDLAVYRIGCATGDLVDAEGSFVRLYDAQPGETFLIRPDGYLAARVSSADERSLLAYFDRLNSMGRAEGAAALNPAQAST